MAVSPTRNLVSNIGFDRDSTHTKAWKDYRGLGALPIEDLGPLVLPTSDEIDGELDQRLFQGAYRRHPAPVKAAKVLKQLALSRRR